ncbi:cytochrome bc1 complex Rieske iron-sulfur subunit [Actinokineospora iranica]|uniref:Cytochrome bc1 complex Rieske iron-sulfur subunit n=1 Tax=Actinokineospora iranica TaxID=1271860 RepID=A0A1G6M1G3_9PSEU|nr:ubiquinol-cytochrome c reductase iron-sulfur subunit [Actinokineospora iranica]SDC49309.1 menaquinol-cytochrome c reductase iron-sulfur subunit precursor [Actinokineospora iranica]
MSSTNPDLPSDAELAEMSRADLVKLGAKLDGVEIVEYPDPWPVKGTRAEKRAERLVALWFLIAAASGLAFTGVFLFWPSAYVAPGTPGYTLYSFYTPLLGVTLGLSVFAVGVGALLYTKKFIPHEVSVQQRHDGGSSEVDKATILAELADAGNRSTIARRSLIKRSAGLGAGAMGLGVGVFALGGLVRDPWAQTDSPNSLWHTGWKSENGEKVFLRRATGDPEEVVLVKPSDLDTGAMETVFPFRDSERGDHVALSKALKRSDNPVMLIRLRPEDAAKVVKHEGQEDYNFGDYYAYTKICSHLGCPTSLYEQRTNRILCPCHQSQFDALQYAKPIFGPATRKLAQLPIAVDEETGYFYAKHDFIEPVGPAFWERKS